MVSRTEARTVLPAVLIQAALVLSTTSASAQDANTPAAPAPAAPAPAAPAAPAPASPALAAPAAAAPAPAAPAPAAPDALPPPPPMPGEDLSNINPDEIEVIKVTVDRREKRIQEYAGAATAFTEHDLARTGVSSVKKVSDSTPFVHIGVQEGNTEVSIRGVGGDGNNTEVGDPSAATHIDGIYIPRPRGVGSMFFDIERIEMNRGPQGTIRGRNATAGSINIVSHKPKLGEWGAQGSLAFGNYSQRIASGMVNIPIGDKLALRVAAYAEARDPFYSNGGPVKTLTPSENADVLAYRSSLKWKPADYLTVLIGHDYAQEKGTGYSGSNFAAVLAAGLRPEDIRDPRKVVYLGPQGTQDMKHWGAHMDATLDAGPVQVNYLGSYRDMDYQQTTPGNGGVWFPGMTMPNLDNWSRSDWHTRSQSTVHELRLYAPDSARFRWTVGGFYMYEHQRIFLGQVQGDTGAGWAGGEYNNTTKDWSAAGYFDATFDITQKFRATAGIRYTTEDKSREGIGNGYGGVPGGNFRWGTEGYQWKGFDRTDFSTTGSYASQVGAGVANWGSRDTLQTLLATAGDYKGTSQAGSYSDQFLDWRAGLDYDVAPDHLLYALVSTGHHSGGFNDNLGTDKNGAIIAPTYKPESLYAFEIGSKNEFLDRKAKLNVSVFDYEYKDIQLQTIQTVGGCATPNVPTCTGFSTAVRTNAANARILGLEIEGRYELPFGLGVRAEAMLLDAKYGDDSYARDSRVGWSANDSPRVSLNGKWLPKTSRATINYGVYQNLKTSVGYFDWTVSAQTRTEYYLTPFNGNGYDTNGTINNNLYDIVPTYTRLDLGVGHTRPDGKLRLEGFVNNVTDVWYTTSLINTPGLNLRFLNPPRVFGVRMTVYM